jgi:gliding motility-associated-like protein
LKSLLLTYLLIFNCLAGFAQKESNNWFFGKNIGVTFNTKPITKLNNSSINTQEGCASISTIDGRTLFYTDGVTVWDSTHNAMPNGQGLLGHTSSIQSSIIVPAPLNSNLFYIFTTDQSASTNSKGLFYNIVDMRLNNGKGDIISNKKNIPVISQLSEGLTAVRHSNKRDYWIIVQKKNSDTILSYRLNPLGLDSTPMHNKIDNGKNYYASTACIKVSPNGQKIALAHFILDTTLKAPKVYDTCIVADFNQSNGKITNIWKFSSEGSSYGIEFSPNSQNLYLGQISPTKPLGLFQYHLNNNSISNFINSRVKIASYSSFSPGALSLGPDGKIYINLRQQIDVIHAPDSTGIACRYQNGLLNFNEAYSGLPNTISNFILNKHIEFKRNCLFDSCKINLVYNVLVDSIQWEFGDKTTFTSKHPKDSSFVYHIFRETGIHIVNALCFSNLSVDTITLPINIFDRRPLLNKDTLICGKFNFKLAPINSFKFYFWELDSSNQDHLFVSKSGKYVLKTIDSFGCHGIDTIEIINPKIQLSLKINKQIQCSNANLFQFSFQSKLIEDSLKSFKWQLNDGSTSTDSVWSKTMMNSGKYYLKLIVTGKSLCSDSIQDSIYIYENQQVKIGVNNDSACIDGSQFSYNYQPKGLIQNWEFGDGSTSNGINPQKTYLFPGKYKVKLFATDSNGCKYTDSLYAYVLHSINQIQWGNDTQCLKNNLFSCSVKANKYSYSWQLGDGNISYNNNIFHHYGKAGNFKIILSTIDSFGCKSNDTSNVLIIENPNSRLSVDSIQCSNSMLLLDATNGLHNQKWIVNYDTFYKSRLIIDISQQTQFNLKLITYSVFGDCSDTLNQQYNFNYKQANHLIIPNVFTPGVTDNYNDCYQFGGIKVECGNKADIQIFNRWGNLVFTGDLATTCWNGKYLNTGEDLAAGTYYFIVNFSAEMDNSKLYKNISGIIHLIR